MKEISRILISVLLLLSVMTLTFGTGCGGKEVLEVVFSSSPQTLSAGVASNEITIQLRDDSGTPFNLKSDTVFNLSTTSPTGRFSLSKTFSWYTTAVTITAGTSTGSFYYKDTTAGMPTITVTESPSQGWTAATQVEKVEAGALDHFAFNVIGNQAKESAFSVSITAQDIYGNTVTAYSGTNTLSDTTGTIKPESTAVFTNGTWSDKITIASVKDKVKITTMGEGISGESNEFNIVAGAVAKVVFTTVSQVVAAGSVSGLMTVQTQDNSNNPYNVSEDTTIHLTSNSSKGTFYSDVEGLNVITLVTIPAGSSSASFYYKDTMSGSPTITGTESPSQGWTVATQATTIGSGELDHFSIASVSDQTEKATFNVTITALDIFDNTVTSYTESNTLTDTTGTISPATTGAFSSGVWTNKVTIASAGTAIKITTTGGGKTGESNTFNIIASTSKITFTTAPQTISAGNVSALITIETPEKVTENTIINLTTSSTKGGFYSDVAGLTPVTAVTIIVGSSSAGFYYKDTTAGTPTITGTESPSHGWTAATQVVKIDPGALDHFNFAAITNQTQSTSFTVSITAQDSYGNTLTTYSGTNTLSDSTGTISPKTTGVFTNGTWTDKINIASIQSAVTITTLGGGKTGQSNVFDIVAGNLPRLAFTSDPQTLSAGSVSLLITMTTPETVSENTTLNLTSTSSTGVFYSDVEGVNSITSLTVNSGTSTGIFYYKDTTAGMPTITVTESPSQGWTAATQVEKVEAGALDHFAFNVIGNQAKESAFSVSITAQDIYGNTVTAYSGTNTLSDTTGTIKPESTAVFTNGTWSDKITIASVKDKVKITTMGEGISGESNEFNIVAGAVAKVVFTTVSQVVAAGSVSGLMTVQTQDNSNNPYNVSEDTTIHLTSNSSKGTFYSDAEGLNVITLVTIPAGSSSASFYYKDTMSGSPVITGTESPSQGWTVATQRQTINPTAPADVEPQNGIPLMLVIGIGVGSIILGLSVGYIIAARLKSRRKEKAVNTANIEISAEPVRIPDRQPKEAVIPALAPKKQEPVKQAVAETPAAGKKKETIEPAARKSEPARPAKRPEVSQAPPKPAETTQPVKKEPAPQIIHETTAPVKKEPESQISHAKIEKDIPAVAGTTSDLLMEIDTNNRIATTTSKELTAFQTKIWESKSEEIQSLPSSVMEELTKAYSAISLANSLVWLATEMGRHSPNLDDQYGKLCKGIAERLGNVRGAVEQARKTK